MVPAIFVILTFLLHQATVKPEDLMKKDFQDQVKAFGEVWKNFADKSLGTTFLQVIYTAYLMFLIFSLSVTKYYIKKSNIQSQIYIGSR